MEATQRDEGLALFDRMTEPGIASGELRSLRSIDRGGWVSSAKTYDTVATIDAKTGDLIVHLPAARVDELILAGAGERDERPHDLGRFRVSGRDPDVWEFFFDEAFTFASIEPSVVDLWRMQFEGSRNRDNSKFAGCINDLDPAMYEEIFGVLPNSDGFIARLRHVHRLMAPHLAPGRWQAYFHAPPSAVTDSELIEIAERYVRTQLRVIDEVESGNDDWDALRPQFDDLRYVIRPEASASESRIENFFGGACHRWSPGLESDPAGPPGEWMAQISEGCYYIAASYDLMYWLLQDWFETTVDLEPLFDYFISGCGVRVNDGGVAEVFRR